MLSANGGGCREAALLIMDSERHGRADTERDAGAAPWTPSANSPIRGSHAFVAVARERWDDCFPMVIPPQTPGGLGVILLRIQMPKRIFPPSPQRSVSSRPLQINDLKDAVRHYPEVALDRGRCITIWSSIRPTGLKKFSPRVIGSALIQWQFVRAAAAAFWRAYRGHGPLGAHRLVDWVGESGVIRIRPSACASCRHPRR